MARLVSQQGRVLFVLPTLKFERENFGTANFERREASSQ